MHLLANPYNDEFYTLDDLENEDIKSSILYELFIRFNLQSKEYDEIRELILTNKHENTYSVIMKAPMKLDNLLKEIEINETYFDSSGELFNKKEKLKRSINHFIGSLGIISNKYSNIFLKNSSKKNDYKVQKELNLLLSQIAKISEKVEIIRYDLIDNFIRNYVDYWNRSQNIEEITNEIKLFDLNNLSQQKINFSNIPRERIMLNPSEDNIILAGGSNKIESIQYISRL